MPDRTPSFPWRSVCWVLLLAALAGISHGLSGAWNSEFGAFEDEPAHLVTALMMRDWILGGDWGDPVGYARQYYAHYPKVAVGQWPPLFHGSLALWMCVFGTSTAATMSFLALLSGLCAFALMRLTASFFGVGAGLVAAAALLVVPVYQATAAAVMTEGTIACLGLVSAAAFGRFVDAGAADRRARWRWGLLFAAGAAATLLTKGSGLALALVPPLTVALARRPRVLLDPALYVSGAIVGLLAGPWYVATLQFSQGTWAGGATPTLAYSRFALDTYPRWMVSLLGPLGIGLALLGGIVWAVQRRVDVADERRDSVGLRAAVVAWALAVLGIHLVVPSSVEERHLAVLAPAFVLLFIRGLWSVSTAATGKERGPRVACAAGSLIVASHLAFAGGPVPKEWHGFAEAVQTAREQTAPAARVLVASDPVGEGLMVEGAALSDPTRPTGVVLRASKVLGLAGWSGRDYKHRFSTRSDLAGWLEDEGIAAVVMDMSMSETRHWYRHMEDLLQLTTAEEGAWREFESQDVTRGGVLGLGELRIFLRAAGMPATEGPLSVAEAMGGKVPTWRGGATDTDPDAAK